MSKKSQLKALAKLRQADPHPGYNGIGDYHNGVYECDHVSPYSKTAGNMEAEIMVVLQDWWSHDGISHPMIDDDSVNLGYGSTVRTNINLIDLLDQVFGVSLSKTYATNLFPFIKKGNKNSKIPQKDLIDAARKYALPQIKIVQPSLVICLGLPTFKAVQVACGQSAASNLAAAINAPFTWGGSRVWCQAHTGQLGKNNRNRGGVDRVTADWIRMARATGLKA